MNVLILLLSCLLVGYVTTTDDYNWRKQDTDVAEQGGDTLTDADEGTHTDADEGTHTDALIEDRARRKRSCKYGRRQYRHGAVIRVKSNYPKPCYRLICNNGKVRKQITACKGCWYKNKAYSEGQVIFTDNTYPMPCYKIVCTRAKVVKSITECEPTTPVSTTTPITGLLILLPWLKMSYLAVFLHSFLK